MSENTEKDIPQFIKSRAGAMIVETQRSYTIPLKEIIPLII